MEFRLVYEGPLRAHSGARDRRNHKQVIRRHLHPQLGILWGREPLKCLVERRRYLEPGGGNVCLLCPRGDFQFVPLVSDKLDLVASLDILLLRPGPAGRIIRHGGDIDNRVKTLLDALRVPAPDELPKDDRPTDDERPFFCLLGDDALVTRLTVETDELLEPGSPEKVRLLICVRVWPTSLRYDNMDFGI